MRILQPKLKSFFLYNLKNDRIFSEAVNKLDCATIMCEAGRVAVGHMELTGNNDGTFVELVEQTVDGISENEAYCIAGGMTLIAFTEYVTGIKSRMPSGEHCMTVWRAMPSDLKVAKKDLRPGDSLFYNHEGTDNGHYETIIEVHPDHMICVGFNTTAGTIGGQIVREGGGVYLTNRPYTQVGDMIIVGFARAFPT